MPHACMPPIVCIYMHTCTLYIAIYASDCSVTYDCTLYVLWSGVCCECQLFCIVGHSLRAVLDAFVHVRVRSLSSFILRNPLLAVSASIALIHEFSSEKNFNHSCTSSFSRPLHLLSLPSPLPPSLHLLSLPSSFSRPLPLFPSSLTRAPDYREVYQQLKQELLFLVVYTVHVLCLVCLFDLACFFLSSFSSLI